MISSKTYLDKLIFEMPEKEEIIDKKSKLRNLILYENKGKILINFFNYI